MVEKAIAVDDPLPGNSNPQDSSGDPFSSHAIDSLGGFPVSDLF